MASPKEVPLHVSLRLSSGGNNAKRSSITYRADEKTAKCGGEVIKVNEIFLADKDNEHVYNSRLHEIVEGVLTGEHGCIMVYGHAGT
eukprot:gene6177-9455_t